MAFCVLTLAARVRRREIGSTFCTLETSKKKNINPSMKLYVGNLGEEGTVKSDDLRPLFEHYGTVTECECIKNYAFVHMEDSEKAGEAVRNLNGKTVNGRIIKVEKGESRGPRKPSQKLFVGNLAERTTPDELREVFERYAPVIEADVIKNFGFVHIDADAGRGKVRVANSRIKIITLTSMKTLFF